MNKKGFDTRKDPLQRQMPAGDTPLHYSILDPTGNITALVEDPVAIPLQPAVADQIMEKHPEVEQVGFVRFYPDPASDDAIRTESGPDRDRNDQDQGRIHGELRMAGGEFCGNASMSAAALYAVSCLRKESGETGVEKNGYEDAENEDTGKKTQYSQRLTLKVSGADRPVGITLQRRDDGSFQSQIDMPQAAGIREEEVECEGLSGLVPVVRMEGISHIIIESDSPFYALVHDRKTAEKAVRAWCRKLGAEGLGLMFLGEDTREAESPPRESQLPKKIEKRSLTPLVYIPGADTVFWENSCASGSAAAGMYLADKEGALLHLSLREPGGMLQVESDPVGKKTGLSGQVRLVDQSGII